MTRIVFRAVTFFCAGAFLATMAFALATAVIFLTLTVFTRTIRIMTF